ncbi:hypothetical protein H5410_052591 [Solanum commersonii]|uniref:Uncharacterized protein n=1 Tax=Solanum commersonii TaxID=4109 RepID=A0A9J5X3T8_SOLCO|nr:hypothetical protein H5410_052591 [Solanum commersonii]
MRAPNGNFAFTVESEISFPIRFHISDSKGKLQENFEGNLAVISETRGEASFEASICAKILGGEAFGDRSERKRSGTVSWSTRDRLSGRLWFSREIEHVEAFVY